VLVAGEICELVDVLPHPLVRRVEEVRAVAVDLDAGFRLSLGIRVSTEVVATLQYQYPLVELGGDPLGHGQAEESGTDNDQVISRRVHEGSIYRPRHVPDEEGPVSGRSGELFVADSALACEKALAALPQGAVRVT
jgi:hypothetical protein